MLGSEIHGEKTQMRYVLETRVLTSADEPFTGRILAALNDAIVRKG